MIISGVSSTRSLDIRHLFFQLCLHSSQSAGAMQLCRKITALCKLSCPFQALCPTSNILIGYHTSSGVCSWHPPKISCARWLNPLDDNYPASSCSCSLAAYLEAQWIVLVEDPSVSSCFPFNLSFLLYQFVLTDSTFNCTQSREVNSARKLVVAT